MAGKDNFQDNYPVPKTALVLPAPTVASLSFESGEQGAYRVYTSAKLRVLRVKAIVTKAIAATDNGTITIKNAAGSTIATLTITLSSAIGTEFTTGAIVSTNQDIGEDSFFDLTTAKTTVGGKVQVSIETGILPA